MIAFTKDMETGVDLIDSQHKELINRINNVLSMGAESVSHEETKKTIKLLEEYVIKHFGDEETLQKQQNFPNYQWHKEQHQYYIAEVQKMKKEFDDNGSSLEFSRELNDSVIKWIIKHIKSADVELGKFINKQS